MFVVRFGCFSCSALWVYESVMTLYSQVTHANQCPYFPMSLQGLPVRQQGHLISALKMPTWRHQRAVSNTTSHCFLLWSPCLTLSRGTQPSRQEPSEEIWQENAALFNQGEQSLLLTSRTNSYFLFTQKGTISHHCRIWWWWWWGFLHGSSLQNHSHWLI